MGVTSRRDPMSDDFWESKRTQDNGKEKTSATREGEIEQKGGTRTTQKTTKPKATSRYANPFVGGGEGPR